jgi:hypothetical protein
LTRPEDEDEGEKLPEIGRINPASIGPGPNKTYHKPTIRGKYFDMHECNKLGGIFKKLNYYHLHVNHDVAEEKRERVHYLSIRRK